MGPTHSCGPRLFRTPSNIRVGPRATERDAEFSRDAGRRKSVETVSDGHGRECSGTSRTVRVVGTLARPR